MVKSDLQLNLKVVMSK